MNVQDDFFCIDLQIDIMPNRKMIGLWGSYIQYLKLETYEEKKEFANHYFMPLPQPITRLDNLFSDLYFNFFYEAPKDMNYTLKASLELEDLLTEKYCFENNLIRGSDGKCFDRDDVPIPNMDFKSRNDYEKENFLS